MIDSGDPEGIANAESCRIASQAWQDIAEYYSRPDTDEEGQPTNEGFSLEALTEHMRNQWKDYCETGIAVNEVQSLVEVLQAKLRKDPHLEGVGSTSDTAKDSPANQSQEDKPETSQEALNRRNRENVQVGAIEIIITQIYDELGTSKEDVEIASAALTPWDTF